MKNKKCCKFHNRLDLKFPEEEYDDPSCGLAGMGAERYSEHRFCCRECPIMKEEKERILIPKKP